jgi:hypothetical protein
MFRIFAAALAALAAMLSHPAQATCGAAFCTVNTNWSAHGAWTERGARFDLRFEYMDQDQPQAGNDKVAVGQIHKHHDEVRTLNRNWVANFDYGFDSHWGVSVALPVVSRSHMHIHNHMGQQFVESWDFTEAGDLRALGRYQFAPVQQGTGSSQTGLNFGLKLPTGAFDVKNADGDLAERTLQPGSGTTDALLGAYHQRQLPLRDLSWFVQALAQVPLHARADFRPGERISLDLGLRYEATDKLGLLLQTNLLWRGRDEGARAEPEDSGGQSLWLSPGVAYAISRDWQAYAFLQQALYQHVNGVQLVAERAVVLGLSGRF